MVSFFLIILGLIFYLFNKKNRTASVLFLFLLYSILYGHCSQGVSLPSGMFSALVRVFNAISSSPFSVAVELRELTPNLCRSSLCSHACPDLKSFSKVVLDTSSPSDFVGFPRRTIREGWVGWDGIFNDAADIPDVFCL